ncbi:MAG TPA: glycosyltransferase family 4 protein [Thermoanaerobaculia bacterium]|nr:glycosyltransferase family 4 protein [Thermoanaerobaculia bacterium]
MPPERRLLFLAPYPPRKDALHGGALAMAHLIGGLAQRHRVALLCLRGDDEAGIEPELRERCEIAEELPRRGRRRSKNLRERVGKHLRTAESLLAMRPKWATWCALPAFEERLRALDAGWRPEVVQAEYHVMGQYLSCVRSRRVLNQYEPGAHAARERWRSGNHNLREYLEMRAWERYERAVAKRADTVVVLTLRDREAMLPYSPTTPLVVIPLGIQAPERPLDPAGQPPPSVLFVGSFNHPPNVEAAIRLARSIFPRVRQRCPETVLHLVGDAPPDISGPGVVVTGRVPSIEPWLDRAAVIATPLASGGGMRVKVLEALAAGKAVVASPLAAEGLDGAPLLLADGDEETAEAIIGLLEDRDRRVALATQAREWAVARLGWQRTVDAFEALYERLVS